jgi:hypothetical protein
MKQTVWTTGRKVKFALAMAIPLALDTTASLVIAVPGVGHALGESISGNITSLAGGRTSLSQLGVAIYFMNASVRFILESRARQAQKVTMSMVNARMDAFVRRLSWWTIGLCTTMIVYVVTSPIAILPIFYTPPGWTTCWCIIGIRKSLGSICRVNMLRSQRQRKNKAPVASSGKTPLPPV